MNSGLITTEGCGYQSLHELKGEKKPEAISKTHGKNKQANSIKNEMQRSELWGNLKFEPHGGWREARAKDKCFLISLGIADKVHNKFIFLSSITVFLGKS